MVTQQVLQVATTTMILSGLNLAVSAVGFTVINKKLGKLESKLNEIQQEVQAIRELLELKERAELKAALRDLINVMEITDPEHRRTMLFNAKNVLAPINLKYKELLGAAETLETALPYEEYFCLTALAHARCLAELDMLEMARRDLKETKEFWQTQARRIVNDILFGPSPERFLHSDFVQDVPVSVLVDWCDKVVSSISKVSRQTIGKITARQTAIVFQKKNLTRSRRIPMRWRAGHRDALPTDPKCLSEHLYHG